MPRNWENPMPCSAVTRPGPTLAPLCAICLLAAALLFAAPPVHGADAPAKSDKDTTVRIKTFPPTIQIDTSTQAGKDEGASTDYSSADTPETANKRHSTRVQIDSDDDFDAFSGQVKKMPWIIGLIFLVVGSIFLTPVILVIGIIWYKLRKTRLQNEAMLKLAEHGVVPPAQAADALASSAPAASVAPQVYQTALALRKKVAWSDLRKGIILSTLGAAFCLYWIIVGGEASWVGLILLFLGVGYIVLWWMEGRHLTPDAASRSGDGGAGTGAQGGGSVPGSSGP
jgi:hypothetical protein